LDYYGFADSIPVVLGLVVELQGGYLEVSADNNEVLKTDWHDISE
jgi:hypothetical protein